MINSTTWTEKYRPSTFNKIILDDTNKILFNSILSTGYFPNMLFYGPPGTGKTTTIINLINNYQEKYNMRSKALIIHLNASDERGIDIIRNNILNFVNSDILFTEGIKFVILDEVDYMTKIAQQALKCLIQSNNSNVRYCLICNYISRIDYSLQYEFIKVRFNKLPKDEIEEFLKNIIENEELNISNKNIISIIEYFENDIRSMINYIQSINLKKNILLDTSILNKILESTINKNLNDYIKNIEAVQKKCNIDLNFLFKKYMYFLIHKYVNIIDSKMLDDFEFLIHNNNCNIMKNFYCLFYLIIENNLTLI
jgi:replication factor C subunit 3/5